MSPARSSATSSPDQTGITGSLSTPNNPNRRKYLMERSVGLVVHPSRPEALAFAVEVIAWLEARGITALVDAETAQKLNRPTLTCAPEGWQAVSFIVTLGGDGTI